MSTIIHVLIGLLPLMSALTWLAMLLAMFIAWEVQGSPHYASMEPGQRIAYGTMSPNLHYHYHLTGTADITSKLHLWFWGLKPLFIAGCCVTTVFLDLSFAAERWLRHSGRLARNTGSIEKILSVLSICFAITGTVGLTCLSIFDTFRHPHLHDGFLLLFLAGYIISAIFICAEYQRLGIHFREHRVLRASFWLKLAFILVEGDTEVGFAVVFIATSYHSQRNVAAVFEWIIALIFTFYVFTFFIDLLPAARAKQLASEVRHTEISQIH